MKHHNRSRKKCGNSVNPLRMVALMLCLGYLVIKQGAAQTCFGKDYFPKMFSPEQEDYETRSYAVAHSDAANAVFQGGWHQGENKAFAMRVNLDSNRVKWRRLFDVPGSTVNTISSIAVNPDGSLVALYGLDRDGEKWDHIAYVWVVRASDGGHHTQVARYQIGRDDEAEHVVHSGGMIFADSGKVFMSFFQTSNKKRDADNGRFTDYAGKMLVGAFDPTTVSFDWVREQVEFFGQSRALLYRNHCAGCANLYVGGSNDYSRITADNQARKWVLSIVRLTEAGESPLDKTYHILLKKWLDKEDEAPYIDHMQLDDISAPGQEYLFGTSRGIKAGAEGDEVYFWKVGLDTATHDPIPATLVVKKAIKDQMKDESHVVAIKQTLDGGNMHGLWWLESRQFYYFVFDWNTNTMTSLEIHDKVEMPAFGIFAGAGSEFDARNGFNRFEAYIGVTKKEWDQIGGGAHDTGQFASGLVTSLVDSEGCLKVLTNTRGTNFENVGATISLQTKAWQDNTLRPNNMSIETVNSKDFSVLETQVEDWCSPPAVNIQATLPGSAQGPLCTDYDDIYYPIDFLPNVASTAAGNCTDAGPTFIYEVNQGSIAAISDFLKVSVDEQTNQVWVKGLIGGTTYGTYTLSVNGVLQGTNLIETFDITISVSPCAFTPLVPPLMVDQIYYVTNPLGTYDPGDFTVPPECPQTMYYTNTITPVNTWLTGVTDNAGLDKVVSWQTDDELNKGIYTVTIGATNLCQLGSASYQLDVKSVCKIQPMQIDVADTVFTLPALVQDVWEPAKSLIWDDSLITVPYPGVDCGPIVWTLVTQADLPLDLALFTPDADPDPRSVSVQTDDSAKAANYPLRVKVAYQDHPENPGALKDFEVLVTDSCETAYTLTAPIAPPDETYLVARPALTTVAFADFTVSPIYCPITSYTSIITPAVADPLVFVLDPVAKTYAVETQDITVAGVYTITTTALTPLGVDSGISFTFQVTIVDPCLSATFAIASPFPDPYDYVASMPLDTQTILDAAVTSSETLVVCPDIIFDITNADGTAFDATLFTFDPVGQTLETFTNDPLKIGTYPLRLSAQYSGAIYSEAGSLDLTVNVIDPCLNNAVLTPSTQTDPLPSPYLYTASSPSAVFSLSPFTIAPAGFCTPTFSCQVLAGPRTDLCNFTDGLASSGVFDPVIGGYVFESSEQGVVLPGVYDFEVTATVGSTQSSVQFILTLLDPCETEVQLTLPVVNPLADEAEDLGTPETSQPWIEADLVTSDAWLDCGPIEVEFYLADGIQTPLDTAIFMDKRDDPVAGENAFVRQSTEIQAHIGVYPITYRAFCSNYPMNSEEHPEPITIEILKACPVANKLDSPVLADQEYTVTDGPLSLTLDQFTASPDYCNILYTYEVTDNTTGAVFDCNNCLDTGTLDFSFVYDQDLVVSGPAFKDYKVSVFATAGTKKPIDAMTSFNLRLKNPCIDPAFVTIQPTPLPLGLLYKLYEFDLINRFEFTHDPFAVQTNPISHTLCGGLEYSATFEGAAISPTSDPMSYDAQTFGIYSEDYTLIGMRQISVQASFIDYPTVTSIEEIGQIQILDPCDAPNSITSDTQADPSPYYYTTGGTRFRVGPLPIVDPPICQVSYECVSVSGLDPDVACDDRSLVSFSPTSGSLRIETKDRAKYRPGRYEFTLRASSGFFTPVTTDFTFTVLFVDPCATAYLTSSPDVPFAEMAYTLGRDAVSQDYDYSQIVSLSTDLDCGPLVFDFFYEDGSPLEDDVFSNYIKPAATDPEDSTGAEQEPLTLGKFTVLQQRRRSSVGEYKIKYKAYLLRYPSVEPIWLKEPFTVTIIQEPNTSNYAFNDPPAFLQGLTDQYVAVGEHFKYSLGKRESFFGTEVEAEVDVGRSGIFARYSPSDNSYVVDGDLVTDEHIGIWKVKAKASYVDPRGRTQHFQNFFYLHVTQAPAPPQDEELEGPQIVPIEAINSVDYKGLKQLQVQEYRPNRPIPYIVDYSPTGLMTIGWNRRMTPVIKHQEIPPTKVAVNLDILDKDEMPDTAGRRRLVDDNRPQWYQDLDREQRLRVALLDSLQVQLKKDSGEDAEVQSFEWDLKGFTKDFIYLQVDIESPENVSFSSKDFITVTFWGVEFFKSQQGVEVEFGTELNWRIFRHLDVGSADLIKRFEQHVDQSMIGVMLLILMIVGLGGRLLPTWMFLNSLSLVVHTPLLATEMPANMSYFMGHYLDMVRLHSTQVETVLETRLKEGGLENYKTSLSEDSLFSEHLNDQGYKLTFVRNLVIVTASAIFLLLIWAGTTLFDYLRKKKHTRQSFRHTAWVANFNLRFVYQFFLEICLCLMINLAAARSDASGAGFVWGLALLVFLLLAMLVVFSFSLFCHGGPYQVPKSFKARSLMGSYWGKRPLCTDCDIEDPPQQKIQEPVIEASPAPVSESSGSDEPVSSARTDQNLIRIDEIQAISLHSSIEDIQVASPKQPVKAKIQEPPEPIKSSYRSTPTVHFNAEEAFNTSHHQLPFAPARQPNVLQLSDPRTDLLSWKRSNDYYEGGSLENKIRELARVHKCKKEAAKRVQLQDETPLKPAYRTLFYGLKRNQPHNAGLLHLATYLLRRVLYCYVIVAMVASPSQVVLGIFLLLASCLVMAAILFAEDQWTDRLISWQHTVNEVVFYFILCIALCFCGFVLDPSKRFEIGTVGIYVVIGLIGFNLLVILYDCLRFLRLLVYRYCCKSLQVRKMRLKNDPQARFEAKQKKSNWCLGKKRSKLGDNEEINKKKFKAQFEMQVESAEASQHSDVSQEFVCYLGVDDGSVGDGKKVLRKRAFAAPPEPRLEPVKTLAEETPYIIKEIEPLSSPKSIFEEVSLQPDAPEPVPIPLPLAESPKSDDIITFNQQVMTPTLPEEPAAPELEPIPVPLPLAESVKSELSDLNDRQSEQPSEASLYEHHNSPLRLPLSEERALSDPESSQYNKEEIPLQPEDEASITITETDQEESETIQVSESVESESKRAPSKAVFSPSQKGDFNHLDLQRSSQQRVMSKSFEKETEPYLEQTPSQLFLSNKKSLQNLQDTYQPEQGIQLVHALDDLSRSRDQNNSLRQTLNTTTGNNGFAFASSRQNGYKNHGSLAIEYNHLFGVRKPKALAPLAKPALPDQKSVTARSSVLNWHKVLTVREGSQGSSLGNEPQSRGKQRLQKGGTIILSNRSSSFSDASQLHHQHGSIERQQRSAIDLPDLDANLQLLSLGPTGTHPDRDLPAMQWHPSKQPSRLSHDSYKSIDGQNRRK